MNLKEKIKHIKNRPFVKDAAILQVGNFFSTFLSFVASVSYARYLGASNYGIYSLVFAFVSLLGFINLGSSYSAITLLSEAYHRGDKEGIKNILTYFVKISLIMFFTLTLITIVAAPSIANLVYKNPQIGILARFVLIAVFFKIMLDTTVILLQVLRKIKILTIIENFNKVFYIVIPISLVLLGYGLKGVFVGYLTTTILFLPISYMIYESLAKKNPLLPSIKEIFLNFRKVKMSYYVKFGILIGIDKNLGNYYSSIPLLLAGIFTTTSDIANFKIAFSYITLSRVILGPVSRLLSVQLPKSNVYGSKALKRDFLKASFFSVCISGFITLGLIALAPFLIKFFYGKEFFDSIRYVYYLIPYGILMGLDVGTAAVFRATKMMKATIKINFLILLFTLPITYLLIKHYLIKGLIFVNIFLLVSVCVVSFLYLNKALKAKEKS